LSAPARCISGLIVLFKPFPPLGRVCSEVLMKEPL
jgi:hypothetical protein